MLLSTTSAEAAAPSLRLVPALGLLDDPLQAHVAGLEPHAPVTVTVSTVDVDGRRWQKTVAGRADASGALRLDAAAVLPALLPANPALSPLSSTLDPPRSGLRVRVAVRIRGRVVATATARRALARQGVSTRVLSVSRHEFVGRYSWIPHRDPAPALVLLGGSEGGLGGELIARLLSARGYPTLQLAYFGARGLPADLESIPLEYFEAALRWLARQPSADSDRIFVLGRSRGAELALLLGTRFPGLIYGVAAYSPSSVVVSALDCASPAWTHDGKPVAFAPCGAWTNTEAPEVRRAAIPVEAIRGPVLLVAGDADLVWPSGTFTRALARRMRSNDKRDFASLVYRQAGHAVSSAIPYLPRATVVAGDAAGGTPEASARARTVAWAILRRALKRSA